MKTTELNKANRMAFNGSVFFKSLLVFVLLGNMGIAQAQFSVNGSSIKIVTVGSPQIVMNDMSYKNEASSTHLSGTGLNLKFIGSGAGAATISSAANFTTNPANVTIDRSNGVLLQAPVQIANTLSLVNGKLDLSTFNLNMAGSTISGGSAASYVKTSSTGVLARNVGATATTFPVGNSGYNPAMITNTGVADNFSIRVIDNVTADGTGSGATTSEAVVNRTWMINEANAGGSTATIRLYWNGTPEEINAFTSTSAYMASYANSVWNNIGGTTVGGYTQATGVSNFTPFTISSSPLFAPLPIELLSLDAQCAGENVIVAWKTASEHNTLNFIVERSENGSTWSAIQTVDAAGNSNSIREYAIEDAGAARGINYYRLVQTDQDGVQKIYGPVMSNCGADNNIFISFPNPSDADITLVFNDKNISGATTLTVRDAHGRVVRNVALDIQQGTSSLLIPDMDLTPGVYYIQLEGMNFKTPVLKHSLR
jgi:hypothetical protein